MLEPLENARSVVGPAEQDSWRKQPDDGNHYDAAWDIWGRGSGNCSGECMGQVRAM
jgi:hypothetical protein